SASTADPNLSVGTVLPGSLPRQRHPRREVGPQSQGSLGDSPATEGDSMLAFPVRRPLRMLIATLLLAGSFVALLAASGTANATSRHRAPKASAARVAVVRLQRASRAERAADHRFVALARALKRCQRSHPGACHKQRRALQLAGRRLQQAQRTLNRLARKDAKGSQS